MADDSAAGALKVVVNKETGEGSVSEAASYPTAQQIRRWRRVRPDNPQAPVPNTEVVWEDEDGRMYGPTNEDETRWYVYTPTAKREAPFPSEPPPLDQDIELVRAYDAFNAMAIAYGQATGLRRTLRLNSMTPATFGKRWYRTHEYNAVSGGVRKFKGKRKL